ncbi:vitamin B6 photo-protection and homoeostasis-domain-containing protein [Schizophyllum fasciatum]
MRSGTTEVLAKIFLPAGFPNSVSPGEYQIYNAIQAFCSSLAGLLSSRALLEGFGVGDASATATNAVLLTVAQDVFSRLTTIIAAYLLGPSLFPEAKTFRFLADVLNDTAIILDASTPILRASGHPNLRVSALCLAGASRAICGTICGGAKAALTLHFATPLTGTGDIGDVNAKDASKETLLALMGMLVGSFVVHRLTSSYATHALLAALLVAHLSVNYLGIRGVWLRTLNRQRTSLAWTAYREYGSASSPAAIAGMEGILARPGSVIHAEDGGNLGCCTIGRRLARFDKFVADMRRENWRMQAKDLELLNGVPETVLYVDDASAEQEKRPL